MKIKTVSIEFVSSAAFNLVVTDEPGVVHVQAWTKKGPGHWVGAKHDVISRLQNSEHNQVEDAFHSLNSAAIDLVAANGRGQLDDALGGQAAQKLKGRSV